MQVWRNHSGININILSSWALQNRRHRRHSNKKLGTDDYLFFLFLNWASGSVTWSSQSVSQCTGPCCRQVFRADWIQFSGSWWRWWTIRVHRWTISPTSSGCQHNNLPAITSQPPNWRIIIHMVAPPFCSLQTLAMKCFAMPRCRQQQRKNHLFTQEKRLFFPFFQMINFE